MENNKNPFEQTNPTDPNLNQQKAIPERGGCLTALLILMMIGNGITILVYLVMGDKIARQAKMPEWGSYLMAFYGLLNIVFTYLIYQWRKIGVIGICVNACLILISNLVLGLGIGSFGGLIGVAILIALVSPRWKYFE